MNTPLVSIVMPVYNAEVYLREAIDSILAQSYRNLEFIIINDGSTDTSKDIIFSYTDPRIRYLENEQNMGIIRTKNKAIDFATGHYIATLDGDDIATPDRIEKQVHFMETHPGHGLCGTMHQEIDSKGNLLKKSFFPANDTDVATYMLLANCFCHSSTMVRANLMKELKYSDDYYVAEDYELWYRISKQAKITNLPDYAILYRIHANNISTTRQKQMFATVKKLASRILTDLGIPYSESELETHSNLLSFTDDFFADNSYFSELEKWIRKLYGKIKTQEEYNHSLFFRMLIERWLVICFKTKRYNKLFYNSLFMENKSAYMNILYKKLFKRPIRY
jgi:glycosyltransferase involved in cell wall biosynthesis